MRFVVMVLMLVAALGCKDKKSEKQVSGDDRQAQRPGDRPELQSPDVKGPGVERVKALSAKVAYSQSKLELDDESLADLGNSGVIDDASFEQLINRLEGKVNSDDPVGLAFAPDLPYLRIAHMIGRLKSAGFRNLVLLSGSGKLMIPLELDDPSGGSVQPVVTLRGGHVILWSTTGVEGTRVKPKLDYVFVKDRSVKPLSDALAEMVQRRWPSGMRPPDDFGIVLDLDRDDTAETLLEIAAAVRAHGKLELFPRVSLLGGL